MNSKYNSSMSFRFTDCTGHVYNYDGKTGLVTGQGVSDPIKYMKMRVDNSLQSGSWKVVEEVKEFPRAGIYAKYERNMRVHIIGKSAFGQNLWVVEGDNEQLSRVYASRLTEITDNDEKAFAISKDLCVNFEQAMKMINKGYGKL